jgi:hypothetical protein
LPSEKRPFTILLRPTLFCCLPHFTENRDNEGPALRARTFYAEQITSYPRDERRRGILPGGYEPCYENVVETFRPFRGVRIVRGIVPDTLSQVTATAICYLSLDMNNTAPEIAAAEHFWDRLVPGGIIVLDDYGWRKQINQKIAFDRFADARKINVLSLPTGQGLLIKP